MPEFIAIIQLRISSSYTDPESVRDHLVDIIADSSPNALGLGGGGPLILEGTDVLDVTESDD